MPHNYMHNNWNTLSYRTDRKFTQFVIFFFENKTKSKCYFNRNGGKMFFDSIHTTALKLASENRHTPWATNTKVIYFNNRSWEQTNLIIKLIEMICYCLRLAHHTTDTKGKMFAEKNYACANIANTAFVSAVFLILFFVVE